MSNEDTKRELERSSMDTIQVYNPTDKDYLLDWDGFKHVIPAKSERGIFRYLAMKYCREMKDILITQMQDKKRDELISMLEARGSDNVVYRANEMLRSDSSVRTDNEELIKKIYSEIWLGVVSEYGTDQIKEEAPTIVRGKFDEELLKQMNAPYRPKEAQTKSDEAKAKAVDSVSK